MLRSLLLLSFLFSIGCGDDSNQLVVAVQTDLVPNVEFTFVRVAVGGSVQETVVQTDADFASGEQVGTFEVKAGNVLLNVQLIDGGVVVMERPPIVVVRDELQVVTLLVSRDCRGVECPGSGVPSDTLCLGSQCGDPRCSQETPEFCNVDECTAPADCTPAADCARRGTCELGTCFFATMPSACADGLACVPESGCVPVDAPADAGVADAAVSDAGAADAQLLEGALPEGCIERTVPTLSTMVVGSVLRPRFVVSPPGDSTRLFVLTQRGRIFIFQSGVLLEEPFLEVPDIRTTATHEGGIALAFHPQYADNGRFFVYYTTAPPRRDVLAEYQRSADPNVAEPAQVRRLIDIEDRHAIHNGGLLEFGPDGFLYLGDEGTGNDRERHGKNPQTLHGSILRLDVDASGNGFAAAVNPFGAPTGLPQIWAIGVSDAYRGSFDPANGLLYVGDESSASHEANVLDTSAGRNLGWSAYAGNVVRDDDQLPVSNYHAPIYAYDRSMAMTSWLATFIAARPSMGLMVSTSLATPRACASWRSITAAGWPQMYSSSTACPSKTPWMTSSLLVATRMASSTSRRRTAPSAALLLLTRTREALREQCLLLELGCNEASA